jgi:hypothetical protein
MNLACFHFPHRLQKLGREVAFGFIGSQFSLRERSILQGHGESPSTWGQ